MGPTQNYSDIIFTLLKLRSLEVNNKHYSPCEFVIQSLK